MNLADNKLRRLDNLTADERALLRCQVASELIHKGQYELAREALGEFWRGVGVRPHIGALSETAAAEVLLECGSLSGWLGTSKRIEGAQDNAKDLISEAQRIFEAHGRQARVADAQYELGMCYWRSGAFDEARLILSEAAGKLGPKETELKGKILIRSTLVEISEGRYHDALKILDEAQDVFSIAPDALKGKWHAQMALVMRRLGMAEGRTDYLDRAIVEFTAAIYHFEQAHHERYCANNLNNIAPLLARFGRYGEAHEHLDRAQRIFTRLQDAGNLAQVRETRARVLLAEKKYRKAAEAMSGAIGTLEKSGEPALLADALALQATVQAKLGYHYLSLPAFHRAVKIAEEAGALESAGLAALSMIEAHGAARLCDTELYQTYSHADELLKHTQNTEAITRLRACARLVIQRLSGERTMADFSFPEAVRDYESRLIRRALKDAGGSISRAANRLGLSYQRLGYLLKSRHRDLLSARTPAVKRKRSIIKKPKK